MRACQWVVWIAGVLYLVALALFVIGTFGFFGQERDPLSGIFLLPLGVPWVLWLEGFSESLKPWLAGLAPLVNIVILAAICRALNRART